jgi:protocatechuate 3,4-dioxygenase beta subunit
MSLGPACQSYWNTDAIFTAKVLSSQMVTVPSGNSGFPAGMQQVMVRLSVSRAYRGDIGGEVYVQTGAGGGDCGYPFEIGGSYLVFGDVVNGVIHTSICSGTVPVEQAQKTIAWLDALPGLPAGATLFGNVQSQILRDHKVAVEPVPDTTISVRDSSGQEKQVSTGADGAYSITGLGPGKYQVTPRLRVGLTATGQPRTVELHERGCAEVSFWTAPDLSIRGQVLDSRGQPGENILVSAANLDDPNYVRNGKYVSATDQAYTGADGRYELNGLQPGRYLVFINSLGASKSHPYPLQFHGGNNDPDTAASIELGTGHERQTADFTLPRPFTLRKLPVEVLDTEGHPVAGAMVSFQDPDNSVITAEITGADGTATLEIFAERSYTINALLNQTEGTGGPVRQRCGDAVAVPAAGGQKKALPNSISFTINRNCGASAR